MKPLFSAFTLISVFTTTVLLSGCEDSQAPVLEQRIRPVRTAIVSETPKAFYRRFAGGSQAAVSTTLSFRISGIVAEIPIKVGQTLEQGQLITRLNDQDLKITVQKNEATLKQNEVQASNAKSQYEQIENLYNRQLVSRKEYESAETTYNSTQAKAEESRRAAELSQQQLSYSQLFSPVGGCTVSEKHINANENVTAGQAIVTLNCGASIEVLVAIPESVIPSIAIGDNSTVQFPSLKNRKFAAKVTEIGTPGSNSNAYPVTLRLDNEDSILRPGMAAEASFAFLNKQKTKNLWIPLLAASKEGDKNFVFVFEATSKNRGIVRRKVIKVGNFTLEEVEVLEGLTVGEKIITAGLSQVHDGLEVKLLIDTRS